MLKKSSFLIVYAALFSLYCCDSNAVFDAYKTLPSQWHKDSLVYFKFSAPDTIKPYNLYINLRNNNNYKYNNLFLITKLNYPNGKVETDTLEYKMAKPNGELLGTGFTDIKENKLWYKGYDNTFKFLEKGNYNVSIQHAMRKNGFIDGVENLDGIFEIGFRIEKTITN